jgi:hypothetical protein
MKARNNTQAALMEFHFEKLLRSLSFGSQAAIACMCAAKHPFYWRFGDTHACDCCPVLECSWMYSVTIIKGDIKTIINQRVVMAV